MHLLFILKVLFVSPVSWYLFEDVLQHYLHLHLFSLEINCDRKEKLTLLWWSVEYLMYEQVPHSTLLVQAIWKHSGDLWGERWRSNKNQFLKTENLRCMCWRCWGLPFLWTRTWAWKWKCRHQKQRRHLIELPQAYSNIHCKICQLWNSYWNLWVLQ